MAWNSNKAAKLKAKTDSYVRKKNAKAKVITAKSNAKVKTIEARNKTTRALAYAGSAADIMKSKYENQAKASKAQDNLAAQLQTLIDGEDRVNDQTPQDSVMSDPDGYRPAQNRR